MSLKGVVILPNTYRDSVELLSASSAIQKLSGVKQASLMMGTPTNKQLLMEAGTKFESEFTPNDLIISIEASNKDELSKALEEAKALILQGKKQRKTSDSEGTAAPRSIVEALKQSPFGDENPPNLVLISVPGPYATAEAMKALRRGLHVFMFSNNVSVEDEHELKVLADSKHLLLMGPDCGTAVLDGVPLAFANVIHEGPIGLVGASGTGLQQVSTLIDRFGEGITQMIGVGGRDLSEEVGGIMMLQGIQRLLDDPETKVIVLVSKPPSPKVAQKIFEKIKNSPKPVVINFLGAGPSAIEASGAIYAETLEDAAVLAVNVVRKRDSKKVLLSKNPKISQTAPGNGKLIQGLFSGGTFYKEAHLLLNKMGQTNHTVIDLGDDEYTVGRAHPMIDPTLRKEKIEQVGAEKSTKVLVLDVVIGYGAHPDPAGALCPSIKSAIDKAKSDGRQLHVVAQVCGTDSDYQKLSEQIQQLKNAGVIICGTNAQAVRVAAALTEPEVNKEFLKEMSLSALDVDIKHRPGSSPAPRTGGILGGVRAINVGLESFSKPIGSHGGKAIHLDWKPPARGVREAGLAVARIDSDPDTHSLGAFVDKANQIAVDRLKKSHPVWVDVAEAAQVIPNMGPRQILHAGPPVSWEKMCGPMKGAVMGAIMFEGWAHTPEEASKLASSGKITFAPCHHHNAVGPMAGIISPSMPVFVVENRGSASPGGVNRSFSNFNEGLGKVLRFGAFEESVLTRLQWLRNTLAPALKQAVLSGGPIDLKAIMAQALQMGDESHNRNIAATCLLTRILASRLTSKGVNTTQLPSILDFLRGNDHFFLNLSMATCKATLDNAANIEGSSVATVMCRNGYEFGLRLSGTGDQWFTAPSPPVEGLYFPGYSEKDANPDMGDSSITETAGFGGFSMAASPAIVRFVGGSTKDAFANTREMYNITLSQNGDFGIPTLDFSGIPLGIDARRVVDFNISPIINTGVAHKTAGVGQIGAGIARAPLACFESAVTELGRRLVKPSTPKRSFSTHCARFLSLTSGLLRKIPK